MTKDIFSWKPHHSGVLFSMLNPNCVASDGDMLLDFLRFSEMQETEIKAMLPDFSALREAELSTNESQDALLIQRGQNAVLIENYMDEYFGKEPVPIEYGESANVLADLNMLLVVRVSWEKVLFDSTVKAKKVCSLASGNLIDFCEHWCNDHTEPSLAKSVLSQYAVEIESDLFKMNDF